MKTVAALFVDSAGCYSNMPHVDLWDEQRDARKYPGPCPIVAHPDCKRWGRFWHGSTRRPHQFKLGDDDGCFESALCSLGRWGGVLEHPEHSKAWERFHLPKPPPEGWLAYGPWWVCRVEQGFYGHLSRKPSWLLVAPGIGVRPRPPELRWGRGEQRLHPVALAKHGYEKARRIGMLAMVGGKDKTRIRNATPIPFRDVLIALALQCQLPEKK